MNEQESWQEAMRLLRTQPGQGGTWSYVRPVKQRVTRTMQQRCPVCEGRKRVPSGFYSGLPGIGQEPCQQWGHHRDGTAAVWACTHPFHDAISRLQGSEVRP